MVWIAARRVPNISGVLEIPVQAAPTADGALSK
jgi:hypothetical protein